MSFYTFLPRLLNMSMTASVAIIFVLLLRLLLKKAPKIISYALWGIVLIRLLCPVSIESDISFFGLVNAPVEEKSKLTSSIEYVPANILHSEDSYPVLPVSGTSNVIKEALSNDAAESGTATLEIPFFVATYVWLAGILGMAIYTTVSYIRLRSRLITASPLRDNIYLADDIISPFVMGLFRPKIFLPSSMDEKEQTYIILHEQHHIRRFDHIFKALGFLALCIHWFNPLVWIAFIQSAKDMEMSCDEAVVRKMGEDILADYTASLLSLATGRHIIAGMPLAFGEGDTKGRIRNLANWTKPAFWVVLVTTVVCILLAFCLLTNPASKDDLSSDDINTHWLFNSQAKNNNIAVSTNNTDLIPGNTYVSNRCIYMNPLSSYYAFGGDSGYKYVIKENFFAIINRSDGTITSISNFSDGDTSISFAATDKTDITKWEWQPFPYTDEEWAALCIPGNASIENINELYDEILYHPLTSDKFFLQADSEFWLVELKNDPAMGTYLWSIYSLIPETDASSAQWEYTPLLSSRTPYFRFEFDMTYSEITAVCSEGQLTEISEEVHHEDGSISLIYKDGDTLCWSPMDKDGNIMSSASIFFTVQTNNNATYSGTIYIQSSDVTDKSHTYTASLAGTDLNLSQDEDWGGGTISLASSLAE